jgi:hypothetical protein
MTNHLSTSIKLAISLLALTVFFSCKQSTPTFTANEAAMVKDSVQNLVGKTERVMLDKGPMGWLDYFENSPDFFMASDGELTFNNYTTADLFIKNTLAKQVTKINLKFIDTHIDPLSFQSATIGANFHEYMLYATGKSTDIDGYFTATAHLTDKGWKYRNLHWSIKK